MIIYYISYLFGLFLRGLMSIVKLIFGALTVPSIKTAKYIARKIKSSETKGESA